MRLSRLLFPILLLAFGLSGCAASSAAQPTASAAEELSAVYTSVAATLTAQAGQTSPTPTPTPTATLTPTQPASATSLPPSATAAVNSVAYSGGASAAAACDNAVYVSDVTIPDGTALAAGESFTKKWALQNSGTCTWTTGYALSFVSGNALSGGSTALTAAVGPGEQITVAVALVAPASDGTYTGYWRLENESGTAFGGSVYVQIVVSDDAATVTPTPTATSAASSTPTSEPSATSAPTSTTAPTATPEPTVSSGATTE